MVVFGIGQAHRLMDDDNAAAEDENLANSMFLRVMRSKYPSAWRRAEEELLFICVPQV